MQLFKEGKLELTTITHANQVKDIIKHCTQLNIDFATNFKFVTAISRIIKVKGLDVQQLKDKFKKNKSRLEKQASIQKYLELIEGVYNFHTQKDKRLNLAYLAEVAA